MIHDVARVTLRGCTILAVIFATIGGIDGVVELGHR